MTEDSWLKFLPSSYSSSGSETIMEHNPEKEVLDQFILAATSGVIPEQLIFYSKKICKGI